MRLINELVNNDEAATWDVPVRSTIKQKERFLQIEKSTGAPIMDLTVGQQIIVVAKGGAGPQPSKQRTPREKTKNMASTKDI